MEACTSFNVRSGRVRAESRIHILSRHYRVVEEEEEKEDFMVKGNVQLDESW